MKPKHPDKKINIQVAVINENTLQTLRRFGKIKKDALGRDRGLSKVIGEALSWYIGYLHAEDRRKYTERWEKVLGIRPAPFFYCVQDTPDDDDPPVDPDDKPALHIQVKECGKQSYSRNDIVAWNYVVNGRRCYRRPEEQL